MGALTEPHGGELKNLYLDEAGARAEKTRSRDLPSWDLTLRQTLRPRDAAERRVLAARRLPRREGLRSVLREDAPRVRHALADADHARRDAGVRRQAQGGRHDRAARRRRRDARDDARPSIYRPDKAAEAKAVFGTTDEKHPGVSYLVQRSNGSTSAASSRGVEPPRHYDFKHLRDTPRELRDRFQKLGWRRIVAFQTRNPMHRAHQELTLRAAKEVEANLLIHPVVGMTKPGDVDHYTRVRCYQAPADALSASRRPRSRCCRSRCGWAARARRVWHAIIRKNYGCTHFIVGRDHAGPGKDSERQAVLRPVRRPGALAGAREGARHHDGAVQADGLRRGAGTVLPGGRGRAGHAHARHLRHRAAPPPAARARRSRSGSRSRRSSRSCAAAIRRAHAQGFTVFFTGLSGSGKSTIANALLVEAAGDGRPAGHAARRRHRAQAPLERARLLEGAPRPQHPAHRLRRVRDHEERRHRDLRADRAVRRDAQGSCAR